VFALWGKEGQLCRFRLESATTELQQAPWRDIGHAQTCSTRVSLHVSLAICVPFSVFIQATSNCQYLSLLHREGEYRDTMAARDDRSSFPITVDTISLLFSPQSFATLRHHCLWNPIPYLSKALNHRSHISYPYG